jgi:hypothetical protein
MVELLTSWRVELRDQRLGDAVRIVRESSSEGNFLLSAEELAQSAAASAKATRERANGIV